MRFAPLLMATTAAAATVQPMSRALLGKGELVQRSAQLDKRVADADKIGYLSFSHGCHSDGVGGVGCTDLNTWHWGDEGDYGNCNDDVESFNSPCPGTGQKLSTPMGEATWTQNLDCESNLGAGQNRGQLIAPDLSWVYQCKGSDIQWDDFCGYTYACNIQLVCNLIMKDGQPY